MCGIIAITLKFRDRSCEWHFCEWHFHIHINDSSLTPVATSVCNQSWFSESHLGHIRWTSKGYFFSLCCGWNSPELTKKIFTYSLYFPCCCIRIHILLHNRNYLAKIFKINYTSIFIERMDKDLFKNSYLNYYHTYRV